MASSAFPKAAHDGKGSSSRVRSVGYTAKSAANPPYIDSGRRLISRWQRRSHLRRRMSAAVWTSFPHGDPSFPRRDPSFPPGDPSFPHGDPSFPHGDPSFPRDDPSVSRGDTSFPHEDTLFPRVDASIRCVPTMYPSVRTLIRSVRTLIRSVRTMIRVVPTSLARSGASSMGRRAKSAPVPTVLQEAMGKARNGALGRQEGLKNADGLPPRHPACRETTRYGGPTFP